MRNRLLSGFLLTFCTLAACERTPCEGIEQSCLAITLTGLGEIDAIAFALTTKMGQVRQGYDKQGACGLPCVWQMIPPDGVDTGNIQSVEMGIFFDGKLRTKAKLPPFNWPTGTHQAVTYNLGVLTK